MTVGQFIRVDDGATPRMVYGVIAKNPRGKRAFTLSPALRDLADLAQVKADLQPGDQVEVVVSQDAHRAETLRVVSWRKVQQT